MQKLAYQLGDDLISDAPPRPRWAKIVLIALLVAGLVPLGLDGMSICLGHWKEYLGMRSEITTPTLDRVAECLHDLDTALWAKVAPWFYSLPWEPGVVLPVAIIVMALAMLMLRR